MTDCFEVHLWLKLFVSISALSCSEGLGGPLNSKPHNISKVHWWMLRKGISGQHATTHEKPKSIQKSGGGNASGSEIMVAKLSRWEAIADSPKILDLDLLGWVWTGSPKAFASVKHRQQHVTFIPDPLDSPEDHSKTSSKQNAKSAWLVFHARILACSEGLGGPLNNHTTSQRFTGGCWGKEYLANMLQPMRNQNPSKNQEVEMHQGLKSWLPSFPGERLSLTVPKS